MHPPLKVVHCLRAPVGGLFRHVCDLAEGQAALGIDVGVICDAQRSDPANEVRLEAIAGLCSLGLHRRPMSRNVGPSDIAAAVTLRQVCRSLSTDIVHGHGAKGGAYARVAAAGGPMKAFYTPHGGSLHYSRSTVSGRVFLTMERLLARFTDGLIFESRYGRETYLRKIGTPACASRVIHNGIKAAEFAPVDLAADAAEFVFVGELRELKGVETLLRALAQLRSKHDAAAVIVGSGPDETTFRNLANQLDIGSRVRFCGPMPAREAFCMGRTLIVPSLAESFPYIVLEALAAGKPTVATAVGGIPEIFGQRSGDLLPPGDVERLAQAMAQTLERPEETVPVCGELQAHVRARFAVTDMVAQISAFYVEGRRNPSTGPISVNGPRSAAE